MESQDLSKSQMEQQVIRNLIAFYRLVTGVDGQYQIMDSLLEDEEIAAWAELNALNDELRSQSHYIEDME